jgi:predicted Zn-dependent protease
VISGVTARFVNPDVTVTFTNEQGPSDSVMGKTSLKGVRTASGMHITSAEITIFRADELYERKALLPAVLHEFGHAIGLQHSTSEEGIMYPMMTYRDGAPNETVGECEFAGLRSLYVDSIIRQVEC